MSIIHFQHKIQKLEDLYLIREEARLRSEVYNRVKCERRMKALAEASHIQDSQLINRLWNAGFDAENFQALHFIPLAAVAWASGSVTESERRSALEAASKIQDLESQAAKEMVDSWLSNPPSDELFQLWFDCTGYMVQNNPSIDSVRLASQLLEQGTEIANASGGFLGIGTICKSEQAILDAIKQVFSPFQTEPST